MSDCISAKKKSISTFDILPNEIFLHIFDYLTSNDIIYSFFYFNERLQNLLLTKKYHFKIPTININFWNKTLPIIGSQIQTLIINNDYLPVSLDFFSNLTSIIISSPYSLLDGQLKSILNHQCFQQLHTFKITDLILSNQSYDKNVLDVEQILFKTIFNDNNKLQIFEYLPSVDELFYRNLNKFTSNIHIHSLTLNLTDFQDIFILIENTPNLIYLNIQSEIPYDDAEKYPSKHISEIKLEEFYLKFKSRRIIGRLKYYAAMDLNELFSLIHLFSSSLITLSLNFTDIYLTNLTNVLFNGIELESYLLKPMKKLKNFYYYVRFGECKDIQQILSTFKTFPFTIGIHENAYLYSLPFSFHELKHFRDFQYILSNDDEILKHNNQLWSKVRSLELIRIDEINFKNLFPLIKFHMPKLSSISLYGKNVYNPLSYYFGDDADDSCDEIECINVQLNSVKTVRLTNMSMKQIEQILIHSFQNLQCLIFNDTKLTSKDSQITSFLGQKIQRIESDEFSLQKNLAQEKGFSYLSNLKHLKLTYGLTCHYKSCSSRSVIVSHLLTKLSKLETLAIYAIPCSGCIVYDPMDIFQPILNGLDENVINAQYRTKCSGQYMWFTKTIRSSFLR